MFFGDKLPRIIVPYILQRHEGFPFLPIRAPKLSRSDKQCESVETTIRKRRLLFAGAVQRTTNERLTHRVMFGTIAGGESPGPGRPENNWARCLARRHQGIPSHRGAIDSSPLPFGVEMTAMAEGGQEEWEKAPGGRRRSRPLHDEVAQGRGGEELATPRSRGRQEQQPRETRRGAGWRGQPY